MSEQMCRDLHHIAQASALSCTSDGISRSKTGLDRGLYALRKPAEDVCKANYSFGQSLEVDRLTHPYFLRGAVNKSASLKISLLISRDIMPSNIDGLGQTRMPMQSVG